MKSMFFLFAIFLGACASSPSYKVKWESNENIITPESVYYHRASKQLFVSNVDGDADEKDGKGHISILGLDGKVKVKAWVKGLNAPKGMISKNGTLWVSDIDRVLAIDIASGKIKNTITIKSAVFLNDMAITENGDLYVSDTLGSSIYRIRGNKARKFVHGEKYASPNGLVIEGDTLYVAPWGLTKDWSTKVPGKLYSINLKDKTMTYISKVPLGHLDGLERAADGSFYVSDWKAGKIYKVIEKTGKASLLYQDSMGLADIGLIPELNQIIAPMMLNNKIVLIQL